MLITYLGKAKADTNQRYRTAKYCFDDETTIETQLFGLALLKWLSKSKPINTLVVLGTETSMWDSLFEGEAFIDNLNREQLDLYEKIGEKLSNNEGITEEDLVDLSKEISTLLSINVICKIIPFGKTVEEQQEILKIISEETEQEQNVYFDFTHGFRHLPFFGLLSIFFLKICRKATVEGIYYGALDMTQDGITPVVNMDSALKNIDWINALFIAENTGNYAKLASLIENPSLSNIFNELTFLRKTNQVGNMRKRAKEGISELQKENISNEALLFKDVIVKQMEWHNKDNYALRQLEIAKQALKYNDFTQSTILALEALISARVEGDPMSFNSREKAKDKLINSSNSTYKTLKKLRNALAHGTRANDGEIQKLMSSMELFKEQMEQFFKNIEMSIKTKKGM